LRGRLQPLEPEIQGDHLRRIGGDDGNGRLSPAAIEDGIRRGDARALVLAVSADFDQRRNRIFGILARKLPEVAVSLRPAAGVTGSNALAGVHPAFCGEPDLLGRDPKRRLFFSAAHRPYQPDSNRYFAAH
jgi:hypothetical protein